MFGFGKKKEVVVPVLERPKAHMVSSVEADATIEEYRRTADALGFQPGALTEARFRAWLKKEGIPIYSTEEVEQYLTQMFPRKEDFEARWEWTPLREADRGLQNGRRPWDNGNIPCHGTYQQIIPHATLHLAGRIASELPELKFFVSGVPDPRGDPFLAVFCRGMSLIVIDCWNEPGFRGSAS